MDMTTNLCSLLNNANKRINSPSPACKFPQIDHGSRYQNRKKKRPFESLQDCFQTDEKPCSFKFFSCGRPFNWG